MHCDCEDKTRLSNRTLLISDAYQVANSFHRLQSDLMCVSVTWMCVKLKKHVNSRELIKFLDVQSSRYRALLGFFHLVSEL